MLLGAINPLRLCLRRSRTSWKAWSRNRWTREITQPASSPCARSPTSSWPAPSEDTPPPPSVSGTVVVVRIRYCYYSNRSFTGTCLVDDLRLFKMTNKRSVIECYLIKFSFECLITFFNTGSDGRGTGLDPALLMFWLCFFTSLECRTNCLRIQWLSLALSLALSVSVCVFRDYFLFGEKGCLTLFTACCCHMATIHLSPGVFFDRQWYKTTNFLCNWKRGGLTLT